MRVFGGAGEGLGPAASGVVRAPVENRAVRNVRARLAGVNIAHRNDSRAGPPAATLSRDLDRVLKSFLDLSLCNHEKSSLAYLDLLRNTWEDVSSRRQRLMTLSLMMA